jgi:hypothetical protein
MNFKDAMAATVQGDWVRHDKMQPGSYIAHSYSDGPRINFSSGSSSGWTAGDTDREADWTVCGPEVIGGCANCHGMIGDLAEGRDPEELCDTCYEDMQAATRAAMPKITDVMVQMADGPWVRATADLPPGHYTAKIDPDPVDHDADAWRWGKLAAPRPDNVGNRDKWGRLTNAPD